MAKIDAALIERNRMALKQVSPLFDQLNDSWAKIEDFFRRQGILQSAEHSYGELKHWHNPAESEVYGEKLIGVQKIKGKWRICYGEFHHQHGDSDWTPVSDCNVDVRTEMLNHVGKLFEVLVDANEKYVPELEQAVVKSHSVLDELGLAR